MTDFFDQYGLPWGELVGKGLEKKDRVIFPVVQSTNIVYVI